MSTREVTLTLPEGVYDHLRRVADQAHRPVTDLIVEAVLAAAPALDPSTAALRTPLAQMAYLNDAALWHAARTTLLKTQQTRLEDLHRKQQGEGLTHAEQDEEHALLGLYRETVLVRAQAAVLLKQRGYDVSDPQQVAPLI